MIYQRVKCLGETVENYQSQWWDWWSQLLLASLDMASGEATGSRQHDFTVSRKSTNWFFAYTKFSMLLTTCTNRIDLYESTAEILANENRRWWTQLYFAIWVGWSRLSTGMKPTDSEAGLMMPTANNSANLNGALETDYAFDGWQMLLLSAHTNSLISQSYSPFQKQDSLKSPIAKEISPYTMTGIISSDFYLHQDGRSTTKYSFGWKLMHYAKSSTEHFTPEDVI